MPFNGLGCVIRLELWFLLQWGLLQHWVPLEGCQRKEWHFCDLHAFSYVSSPKKKCYSLPQDHCTGGQIDRDVLLVEQNYPPVVEILDRSGDAPGLYFNASHFQKSSTIVWVWYLQYDKSPLGGRVIQCSDPIPLGLETLCHHSHWRNVNIRVLDSRLDWKPASYPRYHRCNPECSDDWQQKRLDPPAANQVQAAWPGGSLSVWAVMAAIHSLWLCFRLLRR